MFTVLPPAAYELGFRFRHDDRAWIVTGMAHTGRELTATVEDTGRFRRERFAIAPAGFALRLTITRRDGSRYVEWFTGTEDADHDERADVESVAVALSHDGGRIEEEVGLTGDGFRRIDLSDVLKWASGPCGTISLARALDASLNNADPEGWTDAHEEVAMLRAEREQLRAALAATARGLANWVEIADDEDKRDSDAEALEQARSLLTGTPHAID